MKKLIIVLLSAMITMCTVACKSESDCLKDATVKIEKLTKKMGFVYNQRDFQKVCDKYNSVINGLPKNVRHMFHEDIMEIDGGKAFLEARDEFIKEYNKKSKDYNGIYYYF